MSAAGAALQADALSVVLPDEAATRQLGEDLAAVLRPGDVLALQGDLGAGKSTLARALIRALADDAGLEVPSPTFTLVQSYDTSPAVSHFDLYRLGGADELEELGFADAAVTGAVLVEWPEKAGDRLPPNALTLFLQTGGEGRLARITGEGSISDRVRRSIAARNFLRNAGWGEAARRKLTGDASARAYETVSLPGEAPRLLMNAPPLVLGPVVKNGKAYAEIARSARSVHAFVAVDEALAAAGFAVPEIFSADVENGFLLVEDLGREGILDAAGKPVAQRYTASAELLAALHQHAWTPEIGTRQGFNHTVPPFDREALLIEVELLLEWFFPFANGGARPDAALQAEFAALWSGLIDRLERAGQSLVLRDFHSPNIIWREDRKGLDRLGLIDFQDALIGPAAYDVASLAMDARVTIPPELEERIVGAYEAARAGEASFEAEKFREAYAICAAQRNSKILGIFVRLKERDGKDGYIRHLPRIQDYLSRALAHPALADLRAFYRKHGFLGTRA